MRLKPETGWIACTRQPERQLAASAAQWLKEKLDINSPSRVFTQYGG